MTKVSLRTIVFINVVGALLLIGGIVIFTIIPPAVKNGVKSAFVLDSPRAKLYNKFINATKYVDVYMTFRFFNLTNEDEVKQGKAPNVTEVGPYVYRLRKWKDENTISWFPNGTIRYKYHQTFEYDANRTAPLSNNDEITTINVGLWAMVLLYDKLNIPLSDLEKNCKERYTEPFTKRRVEDIIFGYVPNITWPVPVALEVNDNPASFDAYSSMFTGGEASESEPVPPPQSVGKLVAWEGYYNKTDYWTTDLANMINGTDGTIFHTDLKRDELIPVFVPTIFRSVYLKYQQDASLEGVKLYQYTLDDQCLMNMTGNPYNAGFNMNETGFFPFPPSTLKPVALSKPRYTGAYKGSVNVNISPPPLDPSLYDTHMDIEPITGALFRARRRMQVNVKMYPIPCGEGCGTITPTIGLPTTWFPIMWADEEMTLPTNLVDEFKQKVQLPLDVGMYGGGAAIVVGALLAAAGLSLVFLYSRREGNNAYAPVNYGA